MVRLQPSIPKFRKKKKREEWEGGSESPEHEGEEEHPETHESKPRMQDKKLLIGIVLVIGLVVFVLIYLWIYPLQPAVPGNTLAISQVSAELARLQAMNAFPGNKNINPADYPKTFGTYNSLTLEEVYFCSDVCPDYGAVYLIYKGVDSEECAAAGGKPLHDFSFGGYIGCEPKI